MGVVHQIILPLLYVAVGVALVWALVELIMFLRRTSKTVTSVEEQVQPILADTKKMTEDLKPVVEKLDPLMDKVNLAADAANLELMRIDGILEDISAITDTTARTVEAVDAVAQTPMRLVNEVSTKLRSTFGSPAASTESMALGESEKPAESPALQDGTPADAEPETSADTADVQYTACEGSSVAAPQQKTEAKTDAATAKAEKQANKYFTY